VITTSPKESRGAACAGEPLPLDPYRSLRVRFGMLLGEEDFTVLGAYHRGKGWLHNAWLHRQGVVWGFGVELDPLQGEIRVLPGLALDGLGRELHLDVPMCVGVGAWLDAQDPPPPFTEERGGILIDLHVVIRFRTCLDRQVPSLSEPCEGSGATTAHSRTVEQVEILLRPGLAPPRTEPPLPYHLLRLLFGLEPPSLDEVTGDPLAADQAVLDARADIAALPAADRPPALLEAFRRFAADDQIALRPAEDEDGQATLMPFAEPGELVLADLRQLRLTGRKGAWKIDSDQSVMHPEVRFSHVATATIEELLCGAACCIAAAESPAPPPAERVGPWVEAVRLNSAREIAISFDRPLAEMSVHTGIDLASFVTDAGWSKLTPVASTSGQVVRLELAADLPYGRLRLVVRGSGPVPLLGLDGVPLGALSDNPAEGKDFAFMTDVTGGGSAAAKTARSAKTAKTDRKKRK
jgi:hypothetical protein